MICNLKFPKFNWENETEVVKQGAATGLSMLGILPMILFVGGAAVVPGSSHHLIGAGFVVVMSIICWVFYSKISRFDIQTLY
jgi:hypothetical protein